MAKNQSHGNVRHYALITLLIAAVTFGFSTITTYVAYPTPDHRSIGQQIAKLQSPSVALNQTEPSKEESDKYNELVSTVENTYTSRMALGSGFLSLIISIAIIAALYRYLRRNDITEKPIFVTVVINTIASAVLILPSVYVTNLITGIPIDSLTMILLIVSLPLAIVLNMFFTFIVAKVTERHYNRSNAI